MKEPRKVRARVGAEEAVGWKNSPHPHEQRSLHASPGRASNPGEDPCDVGAVHCSKSRGDPRADEGGGREALGAHRYRGGAGRPASLPRSDRRECAPVGPLARRRGFECRGARRGPSRPRPHGGAGGPRLLRHLSSHQRARLRDECVDHVRGLSCSQYVARQRHRGSRHRVLAASRQERGCRRDGASRSLRA